MFRQVLTPGNVLSCALFFTSGYILLRLKNVTLPFQADDFMIALLAVLGIIASVYILWLNFRRDAVRTLL